MTGILADFRSRQVTRPRTGMAALPTVDRRAGLQHGFSFKRAASDHILNAASSAHERGITDGHRAAAREVSAAAAGQTGIVSPQDGTAA